MRHPFLILIILFIPFVAVAAFVFLTVDTSITIHDTGSGDIPSLDLTVNPDGSGQSVTNNGLGDYSYFDSRTFDFKALQDSIRASANLWQLIITRPVCVHADSSTNIQTVRYNGLTSSDIACITDQSVKNAVDADIKASGYPKPQYP